MQIHNLDVSSTRRSSFLIYRLATIFQVWFAVWFTVGCVVLALNLQSPFGPFSDFLFHFLAAAVLYLHLLVRFGFKIITLAFLWVIIVSGTIEIIGEKTGFPFGVYNYSDQFGPQFPGTLPLAIPLAWWNIIISLFVVFRSLFNRIPFGIIFEVLALATVAVLIDIVLEPVATEIRGYWTWENGSAYFGIPIQNFVGWFFTSLILAIGLQFILPAHRISSSGIKANPLPILPLLVLMMVLFSVVLSAGFHWFWFPFGLGAFLLLVGARLLFSYLKQSRRDFLS